MQLVRLVPAKIVQSHWVELLEQFQREALEWWDD
jgi:hypothetical protein